MSGFVVVSLVFAVGNGLGAGINKTLSADMTPTRNRAGWLGLWNSLTDAGALVGPALVAVAAAATVGHRQLHHRAGSPWPAPAGRRGGCPASRPDGEDQSKIGSTVRVRLSSKKPG